MSRILFTGGGVHPPGRSHGQTPPKQIPLRQTHLIGRHTPRQTRPRIRRRMVRILLKCFLVFIYILYAKSATGNVFSSFHVQWWIRGRRQGPPPPKSRTNFFNFNIVFGKLSGQIIGFTSNSRADAHHLEFNPRSATDVIFVPGNYLNYVSLVENHYS